MIQVTDNSQIWDPIPKQRKFLEIPAKDSLMLCTGEDWAVGSQKSC